MRSLPSHDRRERRTRCYCVGDMRAIWDISPLISPDTPAFPGDTAYSQRWVARIGPASRSTSARSRCRRTSARTRMRRCTTVATPRPSASVDLDPFLGRCRVIHAIDRGALITPAHLSHAADDLPPRVLVRTCARAPTRWSAAFSAFAPETIAWLAGLGVRLVGIDSPSVDPADSKTLDSHQQLLAHDMRVLENLVLDEVGPATTS